MKISVVTISYNQGPFLRECIDSVRNQTYQNFEHIIVDACSTDNSLDIINSYSNHFSKIIIEKDNGPADGLNKGFSFATGDIFYFLNSDDKLALNAFQKVIDIFNNDTDLECIFGSGFIIDENNSIIKRIIPTNFTEAEFLYDASVIFQQGVFFKQHAFNLVGGFNIRNNVSWDGELFLNFRKFGINSLVFFDNLAFFRIYKTSGTGSGLNDDKWLLDRRILFAAHYNRDLVFYDYIITYFLRYFRYFKYHERTIQMLKYFFISK